MEEKRGLMGRIRQLVNIDIGVVIFFIILIYIFASIILYVTSKKTEVYEVRMGTLSDNAVFRGIALREETIVNSRYTGHVNYYNKETDHIAAGGLAYSVDETGEIADYADANMKAGDFFTDQDLEKFREQSINFVKDFNPDRFYSVYDYKSASSSEAQKISNRMILAGIKNLDSTSIHTVSARESGSIVYSYDNYAGKTFDNLTEKDFDSSACRKVQLQNGQKIKKGSPAYRLVTDVNWSIAILAENVEEARRLKSEEYVEVRFLKNNYTSWAYVEDPEDDKNSRLVNLKFSNSMESFCTDRFIDIEILANEEKGLKMDDDRIRKTYQYYLPMLLEILENYRQMKGNYYLESDIKQQEEKLINIINLTNDALKNTLSSINQEDIVNMNINMSTLEAILKGDGVISDLDKIKEKVR